MRPMSRKLLPFTVAVATLALALAACGDDNGGCADDPTGPGCSTPLTVPANVAVALQGADGARITWSAVTGATGYIVQRAGSDNPGAFTQLGAAPVAATQYDDTGLATGTNYSYRVAATDGADTTAFTAPVVFSVAAPKIATLQGNIATDLTLSADTTYVLKGYVKIVNNRTITIPAGTKIVGDPATPGSSLWILQGSKIVASGTAAAPVVFTSAKPAGERKPGDWGGLLIFGKGVVNRTGSITSEGPAGVTVVYTGGTDNNDDSGVLNYVRIEFAGYDVTGTGQELNALSSYAVGRGTKYEYIQTLNGVDDSFEWWGGAVDGRYLISYESGDDHFDWTEGYRGRNQYLIAFQSKRLVPAQGSGGISTDPQGMEGDNCGATEAGCGGGNATQPFSLPVFANFTLVGPGTSVAQSTGGDVGMVIRRGSAGFFTHGLVARWSRQGLSVRDAETGEQLNTRDSLNIVNMLFAENAANYDADAGANFGKAAAFAAANHQAPAAATAASLFGNLTPGATLDWTPAAAAGAVGTAVGIPAEYTAAWFGGTLAPAAHFGAAAPGGTKWWQGWTNYVAD